MPTFDWVQEDIHRLHEFVLEALSSGQSREYAFKEFARSKGIKSVNAVRYKWITTSPSTAELTGDVNLIKRSHQDHSTLRAKRGHSLDASVESYRENPPRVTKHNSQETVELKRELDRLKSTVTKLRDKNRRLRKENRQLVQSLQSTLVRATNTEKPQVVVVVGTEGWKPENLAQFIQFTQSDSDAVLHISRNVEDLQA